MQSSAVPYGSFSHVDITCFNKAGARYLVSAIINWPNEVRCLVSAIHWPNASHTDPPVL